MEDSSKLVGSKRKLKVRGAQVLVTYVTPEVAHVEVPGELINQTIIPGIANTAAVELIIAANQEVLTDKLHLLGSRWLVDMLHQPPNSWLSELLATSVIMSHWEKDQIWLAVPLERKSKTEYCMPMVHPKSPLHPLMNCGTAILADKFSGVTDNTLSICPNSLTFLMGGCKLGCALCSIGLGSVSPK